MSSIDIRNPPWLAKDAAPPLADQADRRAAPRQQRRYSPLNQSLHWITAACMFAILPLAWVMVQAHEGPARKALISWHETLGVIVLLVTAFRLAWRFVDGPPPYPSAVRIWDRRLARAAYWLFFAVLLYMPITGFLTATLGGHAPKLFNLVATPLLLAPDKSLDGVFRNLHLWGQWAVYALIALHLSAVAFHLLFRHDGVLGRMLPANAAEPPSP